jgi:hypothetical protein
LARQYQDGLLLANGRMEIAKKFGLEFLPLGV